VENTFQQFLTDKKLDDKVFGMSLLIGCNKFFKKNNQCELRSPKKLIFV